MRAVRHLALTLTLVATFGPPTSAQTEPSSPASASAVTNPQDLFRSTDFNVKFSVGQLMQLLRDNRHEGWVLAAYPDPANGHPLIGAGFRLDAPAAEHPQSDPVNPNSFLEPSSAQLWEGAGLAPERLQRVLAQYERNLEKWGQKKYRNRVKAHTLTPQLSEAEAMSLLRISTAQAIHNARAYCRYFDELAASQQMALSELVFQMGTNLEQFVQFLAVLNYDSGVSYLQVALSDTGNDLDHWAVVQQSLIDSKWAREYTRRAVAVIAEFDPEYARDPEAAEARVQVALPLPPPKHKKPATHHKKAHASSVASTKKVKLKNKSG
jgi:hypothetical protein